MKVHVCFLDPHVHTRVVFFCKGKLGYVDICPLTELKYYRHPFNQTQMEYLVYFLEYTSDGPRPRVPAPNSFGKLRSRQNVGLYVPLPQVQLRNGRIWRERNWPTKGKWKGINGTKSMISTAVGFRMIAGFQIFSCGASVFPFGSSNWL
jgi:hypothetical protein